MPITDDYDRVPCASIIVDRESRQRQEIDTEDLEPSIRLRGVLHPIIVDREFRLIAGERRLAASIKLGLPTIPIRFVDEINQSERQAIELEENIKRSALHWRDEVRAYGRLHAIYNAADENWTMEKTANEIGIHYKQVHLRLRVFEELNNPKLAQCTNVSEAYNLLKRFDERRMSNVMANILDAGPRVLAPIFDPKPPGVSPSGKGITPALAQPKPAPVTQFPESIFNVDFIQWAAGYEGTKFNFIHCDFPYGINVFASEQSGKNRQSTYADDSHVYWNLIEAFCTHRDRFMSHSAHMMFWFSMDYYRETLDAFRQLAPELEFQLHPLYWHKSDNVGILNDPNRGPRRVVETCFIASRDDRRIVKSTSNCYSAPTDKTYHTSTKPEPVLRYFMSMFCDENSIMLDPTCGSGSSLRAAESLGARTVVGLERDLEHYDNAQLALRQFRIKRAGARKIEEVSA